MIDPITESQDLAIVFPRSYLLTGTIAGGKLVDSHYLGGDRYGERCTCGDPRAPGDAAFCSRCRAAVERLHTFAASAYLSCGDTSPAALCAACAESGERL